MNVVVEHVLDSPRVPTVFRTYVALMSISAAVFFMDFMGRAAFDTCMGFHFAAT
jgi:hypothetical protein